MNFNQNGEDNNQQGFRHHQDNFGPPPMGPPPGFSPPIPAWQVGPSGIRNCLYSNTHIWLVNGNSFWFFPTFIGRQSIIGLRWSRRRGWIHHVLNRDNIQTYQCFQ